jgi:hypothetical protein
VVKVSSSLGSLKLSLGVELLVLFESGDKDISVDGIPFWLVEVQVVLGSLETDFLCVRKVNYEVVLTFSIVISNSVLVGYFG